MKIEPRFKIGDTVWHSRTEIITKQHDCPDCQGLRKWYAISPAGQEFEFTCPRCSSVYRSDNNLSLQYVEATGVVESFKITGVEMDTHPFSDEDHVRYKRSLGPNTSRTYNERELHATREEAEAAAQEKADKINQSSESWVGRQFEGRLDLSDYQLRDAGLETAKEEASRVRVRAMELYDELRDLLDDREDGLVHVDEITEVYKRHGLIDTD